MNKKIFGIIGVIVLVVLLIVSCSIKPKESNNSNNNSGSIIENATIEASEIETDEMKEFIDININEYLNMYNGGENSLVLVGRPTCHYCQIAEPILHNIAYKYDINIYYLNTDNFTDEDAENFIKSNEYFNDGFGTPMLLVVSNGKINDIVDGVTDTKHYLEFLKKNEYIQ